MRADPIEALAVLLEEERDRIVRLWAKQLKFELYDMSFTLRDAREPLDSMVHELARLLRERGELAFRLWPEVVRTHAALRYDQHFDADDLVRELNLFERVLLRAYARRYGGVTLEAADTIALLVGEATAALQASFARILRTEEVRFKEAALMESILEHVDIGIVLEEVDGTISYATPAVGKLLGVPVHSLIGSRGQAFATVLAQVDARHMDGRPFGIFDMPFVDVLEGGAPVRGVWMSLHRPDGRESIVEMDATAIRELGPGGKIIGVIQTMTDRTETAIKTRELSVANEELRRLQGRLLQRTRTQALGLLAGGAAHTLNNLLNVIELRLTLMRREPKLEHFDALERTIRSISDLVARLQEFAVSGAEERLVAVEVERVAQEALELVRPELTGGERRIQVVTQIEPGARVRVDETLFRELLVNLLLVAVERVAGGGKVQLRSTRVGPWIETAVDDTGPPYSPEDLAHLFDPLKGTSPAPAPELSLLLAVGRSHVERWGGTLECENVLEGVGATLRVRLPPAVEEAAAVSVAAEERQPPAIRRGPAAQNVLVVDDDLDNARMMAEVLSEEGYDVKVANSGEAALAAWQAGSFQAALLDAVMPDVSGWALARELRDRSPDALLAMVTGADVRGQNRANLALVDAVFRKPVDVAALDEFLSRSEAAPNGYTSIQ